MTEDQAARLGTLRVLADRQMQLALKLREIADRYEQDPDDLQTSIDMAVIGGCLSSQTQLVCEDVPMAIPWTTEEEDELLLEGMN